MTIQEAIQSAADWEAHLNALLQSLTLEEQVALLAGADFWTTVPIERLGIPAVKITDGPTARGAAAVSSGASRRQVFPSAFPWRPRGTLSS